jgi:alanine racemase
VKDKAAYMDRAWVEINLENLRHNARALQRLLPKKCDIMAVVKANAYGHGDIEVSKALNHIGIHAFAVATIDEGIHLRKNGIQGEILILGYTDPHRALELSKYHLSQTIVDAQYASELNSLGKTLQVHIKVDTGMHRLGESYEHTHEIARIFQYGHLQVNGIFTHLCSSDSMETDDINFTMLQIRKLDALLEELKRGGIPIPKIHIQSSYGVLNYPEMRCGYARVGIALYGASGKAKRNADLKPVLSLRAKVVLVRTIAAGESVGYGRQFIAGRDTRVAVLPIGYSDGVPRDFGSKQGCILLHGCRAPIVGRICMDQMMVDVTDIPDVKRGDTVTLIGRDGTDEISAEEIAANAGTIPNELLSRLSSRLERIFINGQ